MTTTTHKSLRGPRGGLVLATREYAPTRSTAAARWCSAARSAHVMAAKAVALAEARHPEFRTYAQAVADNAKTLADGLLRRGAKLVTGGTDNHLVLIDVTTVRADRPAGRVGAARRGHRHQPQLGAGRPQRRLVHLRHPDRHAGADHPRLRCRTSSTQVAELIVNVLNSTTPAIASSGQPGKAKYVLAEGVAECTKAASAELLDANPLYPGLVL